MVSLLLRQHLHQVVLLLFLGHQADLLHCEVDLAIIEWLTVDVLELDQRELLYEGVETWLNAVVNQRIDVEWVVGLEDLGLREIDLLL